jgi:hypothetical protein
MSFDVLVLPNLFDKIPAELKQNIKFTIKELSIHSPVKGATKKRSKEQKTQHIV